MPIIAFAHPQVLALLLLLPLAWRFLTSRRAAPSTFLRMLLITLAIFAAARPRIGMPDPGADVIILVDRSASCAGESDRTLRELWPIVKRGETGRDRTAIIAFGNGAYVERNFAADAAVVPVDSFENASDLAAALELAANLRSPNRRTAVLCLSDGRYTGRDPSGPGLAAEAAASPFWYRAVGVDRGLDVAAGPLLLPEGAEPNSAWIVRYSIHAGAPCEASYVLSRSGRTLARGKVGLARGWNHFFARDTADSEGMLEYRLTLEAQGDTVPENNAAVGALRVEGPPKALLVSASGKPGLVAGALRAAAIPVDLADAAGFPRDPSLLSPYKLVVLENVRLADIPADGVRSLAASVREGATALFVAGGPNSFGNGGYHRSALDPLLPVEMELRHEKRRGAMAIAFVLDRSGSMAMPAEGGGTKMDLANLGAAESIRLLSALDQVSVIAVDTSADIVVPLSAVDDAEPLARATRRIQSMGGGIYCLTGLAAAEAELAKSTLPNRYIVLFADASDAEEQGGCLELARDLEGRGIRLSVIAMGGPGDSDARFLAELARAGGGEALFADRADGLPALFTREIIRVSRRGFLEERVTPRVLPAFPTLDRALAGLPAPWLDGFNVAAERNGSVVYLNLDDGYDSPILASRIDGRAVTGAALFELDGEFSGEFSGWGGAPELIAAFARRLAGGVARTEAKAYSRLADGLAEVRFEFDRAVADAIRGDDIAVTWLGPGGAGLSSRLDWAGPDVAVSSIAPAVPGHYLPAIRLPGAGLALGPPVSLSYSAEFQPGDARSGMAVLERLASLSGGGEGLDLDAVRRSARAAESARGDISPLLLLAAIFLFLLELSGRRLQWFG